MRYFGKPPQPPAPVYEAIQQMETPVGDPCYYCDATIEKDDVGFELPHWGVDGMGDVSYIHRDCMLESVLGPKWRELVESA